MSIKPILFSTEMVRAILDGRKSVTRRVVKPQPEDAHTLDLLCGNAWAGGGCPDWIETIKAPYLPGDILYVWSDDACPYMECDDKWCPSIHMPKEVARIFLRVKAVRVERLDNVSEEDAIAEGFADSPADTDSPLERYSAYWDRHIKHADLREYGWDDNPWVWVIEFERCKRKGGVRNE